MINSIIVNIIELGNITFLSFNLILRCHNNWKKKIVQYGNIINTNITIKTMITVRFIAQKHSHFLVKYLHLIFKILVSIVAILLDKWYRDNTDYRDNYSRDILWSETFAITHPYYTIIIVS